MCARLRPVQHDLDAVKGEPGARKSSDMSKPSKGRLTIPHQTRRPTSRFAKDDQAAGHTFPGASGPRLEMPRFCPILTAEPNRLQCESACSSLLSARTNGRQLWRLEACDPTAEAHWIVPISMIACIDSSEWYDKKLEAHRTPCEAYQRGHLCDISLSGKFTCAAEKMEAPRSRVSLMLHPSESAKSGSMKCRATVTTMRRLHRNSGLMAGPNGVRESTVGH